MGWIAERLHLGTQGYLTHLLYRRDRDGLQVSLQRQLLEQQYANTIDTFLGQWVEGLRVETEAARPEVASTTDREGRGYWPRLNF